MIKLCEPLPGRIAGTRVLTEADLRQRDLPKRKGILGYVEGVVSVCNKENKNERIYETPLWESVLESSRYKSMLDDMTLFGEPDHPETRTQSMIREGSHTIVEMHLDGDYLRGTVAIFDNELGRFIWPMLQAGVKLGFSTRGDGDLVEDDRSGKTKVDPKTYEFHGVDFVLNPSFVEAKPESITEDVKRLTRTALMEGEKKSKVSKKLRENVEAILESTSAAESTEDVVKAKSQTKGLEAALAQLEQVMAEAADLRQQLADSRTGQMQIREEKAELESQIAALRQELEALQVKIQEKSQGVEEAQQALVQARQRHEMAKRELKRMILDNQGGHAQLASTHRKLQKTLEETQAKYQQSIAVIEGLRGRLGAAEQKLQEAEAAKVDAEKRMQEQTKTMPKLMQDETLRTYKRLRQESVQVPQEFQPLLENAQSEAEVDTVLESIRNVQASRYPWLPVGSNCDIDREALANQLTEEDHNNEKADRSDEESQDAEDIRKAAGAQMSR